MDTENIALTPKEALTNLAKVANEYMCNAKDRQALNESILVIDGVIKSQEIYQANPMTATQPKLHPKKVAEANQTSEPNEKEPEPTEDKGADDRTAPELPNSQPDDDPVDPEVDPDRPF